MAAPGIPRCECPAGDADFRRVIVLLDCKECGGYLAGFDGRIDAVLTALHLLLAAGRATDVPHPPAALVRTMIETGQLPPTLNIDWPPVPPGKALLGPCPECVTGPGQEARPSCGACSGTGVSLTRVCPHCGSTRWDSLGDGRHFACNLGCGYMWAASDPEWMAQRYPEEALREAERAGAKPSVSEMMRRWLDRTSPGAIEPPPRRPSPRPRPDERGREAG